MKIEHWLAVGVGVWWLFGRDEKPTYAPTAPTPQPLPGYVPPAPDPMTLSTVPQPTTPCPAGQQWQWAFGPGQGWAQGAWQCMEMYQGW
jgi:hypothetical protein